MRELAVAVESLDATRPTGDIRLDLRRGRGRAGFHGISAYGCVGSGGSRGGRRGLGLGFDVVVVVFDLAVDLGPEPVCQTLEHSWSGLQMVVVADLFEMGGCGLGSGRGGHGVRHPGVVLST